MPPDVWLVMPTYNEATNLRQVVVAAENALAAAGAAYRILIVDDDSPDGTGDIADELAAASEAVEVMHRRSKEGLGRAYRDGFARALDGGATYVLEMDADLSHDPRDVPRLLEAARAGADLVLGSRYVEGGRIEGWPRSRRFISRAGCSYARVVLGAPIRDLTGGFKCFRADTLREIDYQRVHSQGYSFQIEMTYRALNIGHRVVEIPITFREREAGTSKMSTRIAVEAAMMVPALRAAGGRWRLRRWARERLR